MKKPCSKCWKCTGHRKKHPWCFNCMVYTKNIDDMIYAKVPENLTELKELYEDYKKW